MAVALLEQPLDQINHETVLGPTKVADEAQRGIEALERYMLRSTVDYANGYQYDDAGRIAEDPDTSVTASRCIDPNALAPESPEAPAESKRPGRLARAAAVGSALFAFGAVLAVDAATPDEAGAADPGMEQCKARYKQQYPNASSFRAWAHCVVAVNHEYAEPRQYGPTTTTPPPAGPSEADMNRMRRQDNAAARVREANPSPPNGNPLEGICGLGWFRKLSRGVDRRVGDNDYLLDQIEADEDEYCDEWRQIQRIDRVCSAKGPIGWADRRIASECTTNMREILSNNMSGRGSRIASLISQLQK